MFSTQGITEKQLAIILLKSIITILIIPAQRYGEQMYVHTAVESISWVIWVVAQVISFLEL